MDVAPLASKFARMGARLEIVDSPSRRGRSFASGISLDVQSDRRGEYYELFAPRADSTEVSILDVRPNDRHLLLMVRDDGQKSKLLCGHDERHWFVAGVPESAPVGNVPQAMEALKPAAVRNAQAASKLRSNTFNRRKNDAFIRQGEWFFIPRPRMNVSTQFALRNERLVRTGGGKPHLADYCIRLGGQEVLVSPQHPNGLTPSQHARLLRSNKAAREWRWTTMRRNPDVFVTGRIRHADHKTIHLDGWHQVVMNTEHQSVAMRHVAFLD